jgi:hypothetical protein
MKFRKVRHLTHERTLVNLDLTNNKLPKSHGGDGSLGPSNPACPSPLIQKGKQEPSLSIQRREAGATADVNGVQIRNR